MEDQFTNGNMPVTGIKMDSVYLCLWLLSIFLFFYIGSAVNDFRIRMRIQQSAKKINVASSFFSGDAINHIFSLNVLDEDQIMQILEGLAQ
jgi:hypothetical protein